MKKLLVIVVLCWAAHAFGQSATLNLTLEKALEVALSENPTIKVAEMEVERYDYVRRETLGSHLPSVTASGQYTFNVIKSEMMKGMSIGADRSAAMVGDVSVPLFVPAVYAGLKLNRTQQALAVEQARASKIDLVNAVTKAFYQVQLMEKSLAVLGESEATIGQTVEQTRAMFEAGLASEYDLLTAQVQLANLQPTIIGVKGNITVAKQMLKMYLSVPEEVEIVLEGDSEDDSKVVVETVDLEGNSELRQLEMQQELVKGQIRLTNMSRLPVIAAYGNITYSGQDQTQQFGVGADGSFGVVSNQQWWWQKPTGVGFQVSIPLFSGLKNASKVKQLRNQVAQIEVQKEYLKQAKKLEVRTAVNGVMTARGTMEANEKIVEQAEKAHSIARTRFEAGAGTMLEVNQAQVNVVTARLNYTQAIYDLLAARADYEKVVGRSL